VEITKIHKVIITISLIVFLLLSFYMVFGKIRLERIRLNIEKFEQFSNSLKLVFLSDLHISKIGHREKKMVSMINEEGPDVILIAGDLVPNYQNSFSACVQTLSSLKAKYGLITVLGNSDHTIQPTQRFQEFVDALRAINVTVLINQNVTLNLNGKELHLVGVDDPFFLFDRFDKAIKDVPTGAPTILLAHSPDILLARSDVLIINLLDSPDKSDHHKDWGWQDATYYGPEDGNVYFQSNGSHTIRVQSRQEGVSLDTILLNPYEDIDAGLKAGSTDEIYRLLTTPELLVKYPDLVVISAGDVPSNRLYGKWKRKSDSSTLFKFRLDDLPAKNWHYQPRINPTNYFETDFIAKKAIKYRVWMRMRADKGNPLRDSVYVQFNDSTDAHGRERYRIGKPAYSGERMDDVDLILAGHTHGGQMRIPLYGPIVTMTSIEKKYSSGLHQFGKSMIYVSRGIGTSGIPIRLFCPPEITVFTFQ